jgi:hypothetical protein
VEEVVPEVQAAAISCTMHFAVVSTTQSVTTSDSEKLGSYLVPTSALINSSPNPIQIYFLSSDPD